MSNSIDYFGETCTVCSEYCNDYMKHKYLYDRLNEKIYPGK